MRTAPIVALAALSVIAAPPPSASTHLEMRKVLFRDSGIGILRISALDGYVQPVKPGGFVSLDNKQSFYLEIRHGIIGTSLADLARLLNTHTFAYPGSPLSHIELSADGPRLKLKGNLKRDFDLPVELQADLLPTPQGDLLLRVVSLRALKLPFKGVLGALGVKTADLVNTKGAVGVSVAGNDIVLNIEQLLPPPRKRGKLTAVRLEGGEVVETFGQPGTIQYTSAHPAYLKMFGGTVEFGKLTMQNADLVMSDPQSTGWFDFNLDSYQQQLVAGYSKITPTKGLETYIPGFASLPKTR